MENEPREPRYRVEVSEADPVGSWDGYVLVVYRDGKELWRANDAGEPEDNLFVRDWQWVKPAMEEAYRLGFQDGAAQENVPESKAG